MPDSQGSEPLIGEVADIVLFAPLGLALSVAESLPELARKGRDRLAPQVRSARVIGKLTVTQLRQKAADLLPAGMPNPFGAAEGGLNLGPFAPFVARGQEAYRRAAGARASGPGYGAPSG